MNLRRPGPKRHFAGSSQRTSFSILRISAQRVNLYEQPEHEQPGRTVRATENLPRVAAVPAAVAAKTEKRKKNS